jgi:hypothetical protein
MAFNAASWANPNQFSDVSAYSGLDERQGINSLKDAVVQATTGIAPPPSGSSEQSLGQQVMGAIAPNAAKYGTALEQVSQGNFSGAKKTLRSPVAPPSQMSPGTNPATTPAPVNNDFDYESGIENSGLSLPTLAMPTFG